ncbi:hypothetical protein [Pontimicrobium aquaticum]|uniref:Ig-like domain-containing protein n=1 Tax=Pontimicrobium aquaticum TaxID=2565367 RepID=A0A4U0F090_9FLAO|nr:hypothetical protein [Pontimicrobium aquaticum]TJY37821.1 hypothetical protein E5167_00775 [Pontimicrobium aquaticum]
MLSCQERLVESQLRIDYNQTGFAIAVLFSGDFESQYQIKLKGKKSSVLGEFILNRDEIIFTPIIPFSVGENYEVFKNGKLYKEFSISKPENQIQPKVIAIHPYNDTVPENLLKMYFVFSKPMQQSQPILNFITVTNCLTNKTEDIFLSLENELWNTDHTELTLWLDPGRIKQGLIPNEKLGIPIKKDNIYEIKISKKLTDAEGVELDKEYIKKIIVSERDTKSPSVNNWKLTIPQERTKAPLKIVFNESLDAFLAQETIQVFLDENKLIKGEFKLSKKATSILFVPNVLWKKGRYKIVIESRLEDLSGNNLNRLFETDLQAKQSYRTSKTKVIEFVIQSSFSLKN